jgi:hypothetical protein
MLHNMQINDIGTTLPICIDRTSGLNVVSAEDFDKAD